MYFNYEMMYVYYIHRVKKNIYILYILYINDMSIVLFFLWNKKCMKSIYSYIVLFETRSFGSREISLWLKLERIRLPSDTVAATLTTVHRLPTQSPRCILFRIVRTVYPKPPSHSMALLIILYKVL